MAHRPLNLAPTPLKRRHPPTRPLPHLNLPDYGPSPQTLLEGLLTAVLVGLLGVLALTGLAP